MRILWILALVLCGMLLDARAALAATPASCPSVLLIESSNATYYIAVFDAKAPVTVPVGLTLYAKSAVYQVQLPSVEIRKPLANSGYGFRSAPIVIKNPGDEEFLGATFHPGGSAGIGSACSDSNIVVPSVASLNAPDRHIDPAADAIESVLVTEAASTTVIQTPTVAEGIPVPACPAPFADADVDQLVKPEFTNDVRSDSSLSSIAIRVQLSATGKVLGADVQESSGKPAVDAIALDAAKQSTYHPAYFACQAEASSHVIRIDFSR